MRCWGEGELERSAKPKAVPSLYVELDPIVASYLAFKDSSHLNSQQERK